MNSNKAPDVGFTEGPGCWITSLGPARLQIHCGYFPRRPAFPQPTATIEPHAYGTKSQSRGPQVKVTSHRAHNWLCKVLYRDQASAHSTHESKVLVSPGNGFHLPFALSLVPDFLPKFNPPSVFVRHKVRWAPLGTDSSVNTHSRHLFLYFQHKFYNTSCKCPEALQTITLIFFSSFWTQDLTLQYF